MLVIVALALSQVSPAAVRDFQNPLLATGADPWVARGDDGTYYLLVTTNKTVTLRRAATLAGLTAGEQKVVWTAPPNTPYSHNLWAPELHRLNGKWYVYVAADDGHNANHRMYVLENPDANPFSGRFTFKGKVADPHADRWAIDGTVLTVRGKSYFLWSGWDGTTDIQQNLYIAPLADPWTLAGPRVKIAEPTHPWEKGGAPPRVLEGPQALIRGSAVHVIYSASGSWTDSYCVGRLTLQPGGDPLDPTAWVKHPEPVFRSGNGVHGPGHVCFAQSPDGREDWLVYHAARFSGAKWNRLVRLQPFTWAADDTPMFGLPATGDKPLSLPSGEPARWRFSVVGGRVTVTVPTAGLYALAFRYRTPAGDDAPPALLGVRMASERLRSSAHTVSTEGRWAVTALRLTLAVGDNTLMLTGPEVESVDCWRP